MSRRKLENGIFSSIVMIAAVIIVILLNYLIKTGFNLKLDFSKEKLYSISGQSENIVKNLEEDVTIYILAEKGKEDAGIVRLLGEYEKVSDKIKVESVDPLNNPMLVNTYSANSANENSLIFVGSKRSKVVDYSEIYEKDTTDFYSTGEITTVFDGEGEITSAIDFVSTDKLPTLYVFEGHNEVVLDSALVNLIEKQNISVKYFNAVKENKIPQDAECILINSPEKDFTKEQVDMVSEYVDNGGNIFIVSDYTEEALPNYTGLINRYGLSVEEGLVLEGDESNHVIDYPYFLLPEILTHEVTQPLLDGKLRIFVPGAQAIRINQESSRGMKYTPVLCTSSTAYIKKNIEDIESLIGYIQSNDDKMGLFSLMIAGESEKSKLVYVSTSSLFNTSNNSYVSGANWDLAINSISWMCEHESGIDIHYKNLDSAGTVVLDSKDVKLWTVLMAGVVPVLVLLAGICVCVERRRGK